MPSPIDTAIDDVIKREGTPTNDPLDAGGRTAYGISEKSNPEAWVDGKVTPEEAREIYRKKYVISPGFDKIQDVKLQAQLIDFGVTSGPGIAIRKLQEVLGIKMLDGVLGPETLAAISAYHPEDINVALAIERIKMICRIVQKNPSQLKFLLGWCSRACEFLL